MSSILETRSQKLPLTLYRILFGNNEVRKGSVYGIRDQNFLQISHARLQKELQRHITLTLYTSPR